MMFVRFMFCLGIGLIGLSMVLMTVLETLFADWDVAADIRYAMRRRHAWMRQVLDHREDEKRDQIDGRSNPYGRPTKALPAPENKELAGV